MFWSKSTFFNQSKKLLAQKRIDVVNRLSMQGVPNERFLKAYDFFVYNPNEFDGATIVKDLDDIKGLDFSAMAHDDFYINELPKYSGFKWIKQKIKADWQYGRDMELLGKGISTPYLRAIGLIVSTPIYWIIKTLTYHKK
jgi:hypothetical protein